MKKLFIVCVLLIITGAIYIKQSNQKNYSPIIQSGCETELDKSSGNFQESEDTSKAVDFSDFPEAKKYYTRITEAVKKGVNFSDHYVLIPIGCGTDCVLFAVVNAKTGKVIAYNSGRANYHLINKGSYFVLESVFAGQTREFYKVVENENESRIEMVCSEESKTNMYGIY